MGRLHAVVLGLSLAACQSGDGGRTRPRIGSDKPKFPDRIAAGTSQCEWCEAGRDGHACSYRMRHGCPDGEGTCSTEIPCDPTCCPAPQARQVGLDEPPWGPVIDAAASDPRPPTGVIALHRHADLLLLRPGRATPRPTPLLRLPEPIEAWRWSAAHQQIVFSSDRQLHRFALASRTTAVIPDVDIAYASFDVTASGERAAILLFPKPRSETSELLLLELGDDAREQWPFEFGGVGSPDWDPRGTRIAFQLALGPLDRIRVVDPSTRTIVDSPRDLPELRGPVWHPSGSFLAAWRVESERCTLELVEPENFRHASTALSLEARHCPAIEFSPDGRHLALAVPREGYSESAIEVVKLSSLDERALLTEWGGRGLSWLDDDAAASLSELAGFVAACERCSYDPAEPRNPIAARPLAELSIASLIGEYAGQPRPEGLLAYVAMVDATPQIHVIPPHGGKIRVLSNPEAGAEGPVWSPDGRGLAFVTVDRRQLGVIDLAEQHVYKPKTHDTLQLGVPEWSTGGGALAAAALDLSVVGQPPTLWTWQFAHGHWGTFQARHTTLPGSLDARPSWGPGGLLTHGASRNFDRVVRGDPQAELPTNLGEDLPRMIAPSWHPSGRFFAAWVGAAGHYELAWVDTEVGAWTATGVRYQATGAAAHVAEPAAIAFAPNGSHFAFARPDPARGDMTIEVAALGEPMAATVVARSDAGVGDLSWSVPAAAEHVATADLPYAWDKPAPKLRRPEPYWGNELDVIVVACRQAHPIALGTKISFETTSVGATGAITEAIVRGPAKGTPFAKCLEQGAEHVGFDPFVAETYTFTYHFDVTESGAGPSM